MEANREPEHNVIRELSKSIIGHESSRVNWAHEYIFGVARRIAEEKPSIITDEERELLRLFIGTGNSTGIDNCPDGPFIRALSRTGERKQFDLFLKDTVSIVFKRASNDYHSYLPGAEEVVGAVLNHHSDGTNLIKLKFSDSIMPDNRAGIVRLVGRVSVELLSELYHSVIGDMILDKAFTVGLDQPNGLAASALNLFDSIRLLKKVEGLFDRDSPNYDDVMLPFRRLTRDAIQDLTEKDQGLTVVKVLERALGQQLTYEEEVAIMLPVLSMLTQNQFKPIAVEALLDVTSVQTWLGSDRCHTRLLPVSFEKAPGVFNGTIGKAFETTAEEGKISDYARAMLKLMRYVSGERDIWDRSVLGQEELKIARDWVTRDVKTLPVYREIINVLSMQPRWCAVAMNSLFSVLVNESTPSAVLPSLREEIRGALQRYPHIVLSAAASSPDPARAMHSVVESLVSSGKGKDRRAKEILIRWFLLLDEGQGDTLFRGAPLSVDKQRQAVACLSQSLTAALNRSADGHSSATQSSTPPEG